jgi:branched-subunit amino acid aminotransferase/4-amino-4-deoxychorismate lyase
LEAYDREAKYALLVDQEDNITEGRGWNVFVLCDGVLMSPDRRRSGGHYHKTVVELSARLKQRLKGSRIRSNSSLFVPA